MKLNLIEDFSTFLELIEDTSPQPMSLLSKMWEPRCKGAQCNLCHWAAPECKVLQVLSA